MPANIAIHITAALAASLQKEKTVENPYVTDLQKLSITRYERQFHDMDARIRQLEKHIHYPHSNAANQQPNAHWQTGVKEAAARAQAEDEYRAQLRAVQAKAEGVPMRSDVETILVLTAFAKRLIDHHDLAFAVTLEVRNEARRALGLKEREV